MKEIKLPENVVIEVHKILSQLQAGQVARVLIAVDDALRGSVERSEQDVSEKGD